MNVTNEYTYTLETIVQAGRSKIAMTSVPIRTNGELRPSRLFNSMFGYVKRSMVTIVRAYIVYKPMKFFATLGVVIFLVGTGIGLRFMVYYFLGSGAGHIQSLILSSTLMMLGFMTIGLGLLGDLIAVNRKLIEDMQYRIKDIHYNQDNQDK